MADWTWQSAGVFGVIGTFLIIWAVQIGVWIGRAQECRRWLEAAWKKDPIIVNTKPRCFFYVVPPANMEQYKRAMQFMVTDRPAAASQAIARARGGLSEPRT